MTTTPITCFGYVEDEPSKEVALKMLEARNAICSRRIDFKDGFPNVKGGRSKIENLCSSFLNMSKADIYTFAIIDLDASVCPSGVIEKCFNIPSSSLPKEVIFRIAVREIESWIMADREEWAEFIEIPKTNFSENPDGLENPKDHLLNIIRRKGKKKRHKEMLPTGTMHVGIAYNKTLCEFIAKRWSPERASLYSPSLKRAMDALKNI